MLFALLKKLHLTLLLFGILSKQELYEGNRCSLENGRRGICKKLQNCPFRLQEVQAGKRDSISAGRCGFEDFVEIVCCPENTVQQITQIPTTTSTLEEISRIPTTSTIGNQCTLRDGSRGMCKKLLDCSRSLQGNPEKQFIYIEYCSSDASSNIICCPMNETKQISERPAEIACREYAEAVQKLTDEQEFGITVFGGYKAKPYEFVFMAALGFANNAGGAGEPPIRYSCGGSLISYEHVLTAAHCVNNIDEFVPVEVFLGSVNLLSTSKQVQRIPISRIITHPQHKRSRAYDDVAILKLQRKIRLSQAVQPTCLFTKPPSTVNGLDSTKFIVTGWGATSFDEDVSNDLLRTPELSPMNLEECGRHYTSFAKLPNGIVDSMICVQDLNKTRNADACRGDSGGPLILKTESLKGLIGVTAFGQPCGSATPGVYTAIYPYLQWIEEQVWAKN